MAAAFDRPGSLEEANTPPPEAGAAAGKRAAPKLCIPPNGDESIFSGFLWLFDGGSLGSLSEPKSFGAVLGMIANPDDFGGFRDGPGDSDKEFEAKEPGSLVGVAGSPANDEGSFSVCVGGCLGVTSSGTVLEDAAALAFDSITFASFSGVVPY